MNCCTCCGPAPLSAGARANLYKQNFIPQKWRLSYFRPLTEGVALYLDGYCKNCHDDLEEMIPLPKASTMDEVFELIYNTMCSAHPYSDFFANGLGVVPDGAPTYYGGPKARNTFYQSRDKKNQHHRNVEFLRLFHDYDREAARLWLEANHPTQGHTEVLRDTGGSLFCTALRMAKRNGDFDKAAPIVDYVLPCQHETGTREGDELTAYEFDFVPAIIRGGSEGIYLDCCLRGKFDESGRSMLNVGTVKTLDRSLEAAKILAELGGALMYYADRYVNEQLHRYTPVRELVAEEKRKYAEKGCDAQ